MLSKETFYLFWEIWTLEDSWVLDIDIVTRDVQCVYSEKSGWSGWRFLAAAMQMPDCDVTDAWGTDCWLHSSCAVVYFPPSLSGSCEIWQRAASQTQTLGATDAEKKLKKTQERGAERLRERCKTKGSAPKPSELPTAWCFLRRH